MPSQGQRKNPPPAPQPATPYNAAWTQGSNGSWTWTPGATPDPNLASKWGWEALTDPRRDPNGNLNHGAWTPVHGGGWAWTWGANPNPNLVKTWGAGALTNPNQTPQGGGGVADPPPPNVNPPGVADSWGGVAPSVTGTLPPLPAGSKPQTVSQPPSHPAYLVSPGGIRNTENALLGQVDAQIADYNALKAYVANAAGQNLYTDGPTRDLLLSVQDNMLLQIGDAIELAGQFIAMLNYSAQAYARADIDSFLPQS